MSVNRFRTDVGDLSKVTNSATTYQRSYLNEKHTPDAEFSIHSPLQPADHVSLAGKLNCIVAMVLRATSDEMDKMRDLVGHSDRQDWEKTWQANVLPWDKLGAVQPPLQALLLSDEQVWPKQGRALVPGCGRGYDAIFIAKTLGLDTLAIDISPTAIQNAHAYLSSSSLCILPGKVTFQETDFFTLSVQKEEAFDLVYDYTFFVAIHPSKRQHWAQQMDALVRPGGFLIALIFPMNPPNIEGPPFYTRPEHYLQVLSDNWEKVIDRTPKESEETHVGFEHLIVWRKLQ